MLLDLISGYFRDTTVAFEFLKLTVDIEKYELEPQSQLASKFYVTDIISGLGILDADTTNTNKNEQAITTPKQSIKQASKHNKQTCRQTSKQANKQASKKTSNKAKREQASKQRNGSKKQTSKTETTKHKKK